MGAMDVHRAVEDGVFVVIEIPPQNIVHIAVLVIVDAVVWDLAGVTTYGIGQLWVVVFVSLVDQADINGF